MTSELMTPTWESVKAIPEAYILGYTDLTIDRAWRHLTPAGFGWWCETPGAGRGGLEGDAQEAFSFPWCFAAKESGNCLRRPWGWWRQLQLPQDKLFNIYRETNGSIGQWYPPAESRGQMSGTPRVHHHNLRQKPLYKNNEKEGKWKYYQ